MIHRAILAAAALLVPRSRRAEWLSEWTAELWYLLNADVHDNQPGAWRFCLGAFHDALWLRQNALLPRINRESPAACLFTLAVCAAAAIAAAANLPGVLEKLSRQPALAHLLMIVIAILLLPAVASVETGARGVRGGAFLIAKFVLVLPAVFFGTVDLAPLVAAAALQPHASLVGYLLAFRWILKDQRSRCPVCLRLLRNPVRIGQPSNVFLDWYGTELMCVKGHGLLHVPEIPTVSFRKQQWQTLDASWRSLFQNESPSTIA